MKKSLIFLAVVCLFGCEDITRKALEEFGPDYSETDQEEPYTKEVQLTASVDKATGPEELETAYLSTGFSSVVNCDDGEKYEIIGKPDPITKIFKFQRIYITSDDFENYNCELRVFFEGSWTALEQERFFYQLLEFDPVKTREDIFIEFEEIVIK